MAKEQNLKPFKKGFDERRNLKGAPPKTITELKDFYLNNGTSIPSKREIHDLYLLLIVLTENDLKEIVKNFDNPMLIRVIARSILSGKGFDIIERMLRGIGMLTNKTEIEGEIVTINKDVDLKKLTLDELRQLEGIADKLQRD